MICGSVCSPNPVSRLVSAAAAFLYIILMAVVSTTFPNALLVVAMMVLPGAVSIILLAKEASK